MTVALAWVAGLRDIGAASTQLGAGTRAADIVAFWLALGSRVTARDGGRPRVFLSRVRAACYRSAAPMSRSPAEKRPATSLKLSADR